ncbi:hypothetical protein B4U80_13463, partial [Leptotrombidium deliense]
MQRSNSTNFSNSTLNVKRNSRSSSSISELNINENDTPEKQLVQQQEVMFDENNSRQESRENLREFSLLKKVFDLYPTRTEIFRYLSFDDMIALRIADKQFNRCVSEHLSSNVKSINFKTQNYGRVPHVPCIVIDERQRATNTYNNEMCKSKASGNMCLKSNTHNNNNNRNKSNGDAFNANEINDSEQTKPIKKVTSLEKYYINRKSMIATPCSSSSNTNHVANTQQHKCTTYGTHKRNVFDDNDSNDSDGYRKRPKRTQRQAINVSHLFNDQIGSLSRIFERVESVRIYWYLKQYKGNFRILERFVHAIASHFRYLKRISISASVDDVWSSNEQLKPSVTDMIADALCGRIESLSVDFWPLTDDDVCRFFRLCANTLKSITLLNTNVDGYFVCSLPVAHSLNALTVQSVDLSWLDNEDIIVPLTTNYAHKTSRLFENNDSNKCNVKINKNHANSKRMAESTNVSSCATSSKSVKRELSSCYSLKKLHLERSTRDFPACNDIRPIISFSRIPVKLCSRIVQFAPNLEILKIAGNRLLNVHSLRLLENLKSINIDVNQYTSTTEDNVDDKDTIASTIVESKFNTQNLQQTTLSLSGGSLNTSSKIQQQHQNALKHFRKCSLGVFDNNDLSKLFEDLFKYTLANTITIDRLRLRIIMDASEALGAIFERRGTFFHTRKSKHSVRHIFISDHGIYHRTKPAQYIHEISKNKQYESGTQDQSTSYNTNIDSNNEFIDLYDNINDDDMYYYDDDDNDVKGAKNDFEYYRKYRTQPNTEKYVDSNSSDNYTDASTSNARPSSSSSSSSSLSSSSNYNWNAKKAKHKRKAHK